MPFGDRLTLAVLIDGQVQAELTDMTVNGESNAQEARTILQGLVGKSQGGAQLELSGTWSIPLAGPEFDVATSVALGTYHEVQVPLGPKSLISNGWFQNFGASQSTDGMSQMTGTFKGTLTKPE